MTKSHTESTRDRNFAVLPPAILASPRPLATLGAGADSSRGPRTATGRGQVEADLAELMSPEWSRDATILSLWGLARATVSICGALGQVLVIHSFPVGFQLE